MDIRSEIRAAISSSTYVDGKLKYYLQVSGKKIYIYLTEEARGDNMLLPSLPLIELSISSAPFEVRNIGGDKRLEECNIDASIYIATEYLPRNVTAEEFLNGVTDALIAAIRSKAHLVSNCDFMNEVTIRDINEQNYGKLGVLHRLVEIYAMRWV